VHPLDVPIWSALNGPQAGFAFGDARAKRFPQDVSPFAAAADNSHAAVAALSRLIAPGDDISLLQVAPPAPPPGVVSVEAAGVQMVLQAFSGGRRSPAVDVVALGDDDAEEMLELALLTRPGPFRARTNRMGRFIGVRRDGRLIAMCGERLQPEGYVELSGLCTHPDHRGQGLGEMLLRRVGERALEEGRVPFLHAYATNTGAIALYRRMGFDVRADVVHAIWRTDRPV
jgi:ribosomal protein S18 acetylase RimI-like enzyme